MKKSIKSILKKLLIVVFLVFTTSFTPTSKKVDKKQTYDIVTYIKWTPSYSGYWTYSKGYSIYNDFDWMVSRSTYSYNGYYYFDFWFFSQSYYWDGYQAQYTTTNIKKVDVYFDGSWVLSDKTPLGITFDKTYNAVTLRVMSKNPQPKIYFKWGSMNAK